MVDIDPQYDFRQLGETWSTPRIIRIKVSGKDKWVAVFGGGYNGAVNPNIGSAVFVIDLEDEGRLLNVIDIKSQNAQIIYTYRSYLGSSHSYFMNNNTELDISRLFPNLTFDVSKGGL